MVTGQGSRFTPLEVEEVQLENTVEPPRSDVVDDQPVSTHAEEGVRCTQRFLSVTELVNMVEDEAVFSASHETLKIG